MTEQDLLKKLFNLMEKRVGSISKDSYVKSLLDQGKVKINEKVLEEALELLEATNYVTDDKNKKIIHYIINKLYVFKNVLLTTIDIQKKKLL